MELSSKKKLHALSLAEKIQVLELLDESKMSQSEVARRFQVSQPQISRICKNKEKLLADWCSGTANRERKRKRESKYSGIDEALLCWYHIARAKAWDVTGPMLLHKAKELADIMGQDFMPSIGWLVRWKRRNNVGFGARHILSPPFPPEPPPPPGLTSRSQPPLSLKDFSPEDVFGCAEVPLLYRAVPGRVGTCDRLQVLLCANSRGMEKQQLLVGGLQAAPRCFFGVSTEALPASYHPNLGIPWPEWLARFDLDMGRQGRQVALLLAARMVEELAGLPGLCHVQLLPLATTSSMPSLPSSVVRAFKAHYRHRLLGKLAAARNEGDSTSGAEAGAGITVLDALHMAAAAWAKVPPQLILSSFVQEGLAPGKTPTCVDKVSEMPPVPKGLSLEEFARFVDLEGEESVPGVCKEEPGPRDEEGSRGDGFEPLPTKADALWALGTLRRWFECHGTSPELFQKFYDCEEEVERLCCP
ncbi:tigger transposable element-derived protein 3 [Choloepus didactylus]|uniref:tigger transposable element-derived protein 3 n=1 Tax=Choloepus didactylus TaxID=27675 RepID=UPI00189EA776|nr:tigger transposable element-derived protein 3 [Choloepus didactylus]XP_037695971.1 tigger transposable element-derived protein 3 [Choloepus didactylus]